MFETQTPAEMREEMLRQIELAHDWLRVSNFHGDIFDICQICNLRRFYTPEQNGFPGYFTFRLNERQVNFKDVLSRGC